MTAAGQFHDENRAPASRSAATHTFARQARPPRRGHRTVSKHAGSSGNQSLKPRPTQAARPKPDEVQYESGPRTSDRGLAGSGPLRRRRPVSRGFHPDLALPYRVGSDRGAQVRPAARGKGRGPPLGHPRLPPAGRGPVLPRQPPLIPLHRRRSRMSMASNRARNRGEKVDISVGTSDFPPRIARPRVGVSPCGALFFSW